MALLVLDRSVADRLRARRIESGAERWDEVWDGVYVIPPTPDIEHQELVVELVYILKTVIGIPGLGRVFPGVNVSDRDDDWTKNYRCPDVDVFLRGGSAIDREAYWLGGPDFAVEIITPEDRVHEKLPFYAKVGVRELLVIDRKPWKLELYRLQDDDLSLVGTSTEPRGIILPSTVLPLTFRVVPGEPRPQIEVATIDDGPRWTI